MSRRSGGFLGIKKNVSQSDASGIWGLDSVLLEQKAGRWPLMPLPISGASIDYLVVAGGGGGAGARGGGGGAGGYRTTTGTTGGGGNAESTLTGLSNSTNYVVTVGNPGVGGDSFYDDGDTGFDSIFYSITSKGGGGGGSYTNPTGRAGLIGGSGGGGGGGESGTSSAGARITNPIQGNIGGTGLGASSGGNPGGGGGGAAAAGQNAPNSTNAGDGGNGLTNSITGISTTYAGGGGGGTSTTGGQGLGGSGGGGDGGDATVGSQTAGEVNTGGGGGSTGGGAAPWGSNGGSGIVVISYPDNYENLKTIHASHVCNEQSAGTTDAPAPSTVRAGYKTYIFTAGSGVISW